MSEVVGFTRKFYSQLSREERYPLPITPGLKNTPLDRSPQPTHSGKHQGWSKDCPLCLELMEWVYKTTNPVIDYMLDGHGAKQDV